MGTIKFFNGGQCITEAILFTTSNGLSIVSTYSLSVYPQKTYDNVTLTTESADFITPYVNLTNSLETYYYARFHTYSDRTLFKASSDGTHDKTLYAFHNVVADVSVIAEETINGIKYISMSLTNNGNEAVTVKSFQRSNPFKFTSVRSTGYPQKYYLDWAYYLDESEWITLEAGETKAITLTITIADLTA